MKILSLVLFVFGVVFCIVAFIGHDAAWAPAAICFFSATTNIAQQRNNNQDKK